jgi:2-octaprenyl-3-methyl-6-methoxy-1,4-benzoquinol hydroxylase
MINNEVLIVGGGMVGAAVAVDLGRRGLPVRLIEARPADRPGPEAPMRLRVSALNGRSIEYLQALGAWPALDETRVASFDELETWDGAGPGRLAFGANELGLERLGVFLENDHLQAALLETAATLESVRLDVATGQLDVQPGPDGPRLFVAGEGELTPALTVAADGAGSRLRDAAGIGVWEGDYRQHAVVASVKTNPPAGTRTWQRFTPEGPQALLPLAGGAASLVWYVSPSRARLLTAMSESDFVDAVESAFPSDLGLIDQVNARGSFPIRRLHAHRYWQNQLALVGDAAHVIHPLAGQGVNIGLRDARALADRIAEAHRRGLPPAHPAGLAAYERERRPDNQLMQSTMTAFHLGFTAPLGPLAPLRGLGLKVASQGGWLKRRVLRYAMEGR